VFFLKFGIVLGAGKIISSDSTFLPILLELETVFHGESHAQFAFTGRATAQFASQAGQ
jgi:hypothetical protein